MKRVIVPVMLGFGVTLALVIGQRMTTDAMAVVLGVAVGVAASVPTSILLVALVRRAQRETGGRLEPARGGAGGLCAAAATSSRAESGRHPGTAQRSRPPTCRSRRLSCCKMPVCAAYASSATRRSHVGLRTRET